MVVRSRTVRGFAESSCDRLSYFSGVPDTADPHKTASVTLTCQSTESRLGYGGASFLVPSSVARSSQDEYRVVGGVLCGRWLVPRILRIYPILVGHQGLSD